MSDGSVRSAILSSPTGGLAGSSVSTTTNRPESTVSRWTRRWSWTKNRSDSGCTTSTPCSARENASSGTRPEYSGSCRLSTTVCSPSSSRWARIPSTTVARSSRSRLIATALARLDVRSSCVLTSGRAKTATTTTAGQRQTGGPADGGRAAGQQPGEQVGDRQADRDRHEERQHVRPVVEGQPVLLDALGHRGAVVEAGQGDDAGHGAEPGPPGLGAAPPPRQDAHDRRHAARGQPGRRRRLGVQPHAPQLGAAEEGRQPQRVGQLPDRPRVPELVLVAVLGEPQHHPEVAGVAERLLGQHRRPHHQRHDRGPPDAPAPARAGRRGRARCRPAATPTRPGRGRRW